MNQAIQFLAEYGVAALFASILIEQAGVPVSSAPLLLAVGSLAGLGRINLTGAIFAAVAACLLADGAWYKVGCLRRSAMLRKGADTPLKSQRRGRFNIGTSKYRWFGVLLLAKFLPGPNFASPMAGVSGVTRIHFLTADMIASALWACGYITVGYAFKKQFQYLTMDGSRIGLLLVVLTFALGAVVLIRSKCRQKLDLSARTGL